MCGIAGLIHRGRTSDIGEEMTKMLQSLKHRGPDSTGYALYGPGAGTGKYVLRFKVAEQEELRHGFKIRELIKERRAEVDHRLKELGAKILEQVEATGYANKYVIEYSGELKKLVDYLEDVEAVELLSVGHGLELVKDLGDAKTVADQYKLHGFKGTHALGHTRMATEFGRRHPLGASLLGLSVQRRVGSAQRPAH